jgi:hypothetical protein
MLSVVGCVERSWLPYILQGYGMWTGSKFFWVCVLWCGVVSVKWGHSWFYGHYMKGIRYGRTYTCSSWTTCNSLLTNSHRRNWTDCIHLDTFHDNWPHGTGHNTYIRPYTGMFLFHTAFHCFCSSCILFIRLSLALYSACTTHNFCDYITTTPSNNFS